MYYIGQQVMVAPRSRKDSPVLVTISEILTRDNANGTVTKFYNVDPPQFDITGMSYVFYESQLIPLDDEVTEPGGLIEL